MNPGFLHDCSNWVPHKSTSHNSLYLLSIFPVRNITKFNHNNNKHERQETLYLVNTRRTVTCENDATVLAAPVLSIGYFTIEAMLRLCDVYEAVIAGDVNAKFFSFSIVVCPGTLSMMHQTSTLIAACTSPAKQKPRRSGVSGKKSKLTVKPGSVVDSHSSRPAITHWLKQPTRVQYGPYLVNPYLALLRVEFTVPRTVASRAVRSYRTLSPLPDPISGPSAVCSLLHWS